MSDIITLKQLCTDLKFAPKEARERLRAADAKFPALAISYKLRTPWQCPDLQIWLKANRVAMQVGAHRRHPIQTSIGSRHCMLGTLGYADRADAYFLSAH